MQAGWFATDPGWMVWQTEHLLSRSDSTQLSTSPPTLPLNPSPGALTQGSTWPGGPFIRLGASHISRRVAKGDIDNVAQRASSQLEVSTVFCWFLSLTLDFNINHSKKNSRAACDTDSV